MKKKFKIEVDCANCAAKMEAAAQKVEGVNSVSVSFMTQKLAVDIDDARFDETLAEVVRVCKKVDSDFEIEL